MNKMLPSAYFDGKEKQKQLYMGPWSGIKSTRGKMIESTTSNRGRDFVILIHFQSPQEAQA